MPQTLIPPTRQARGPSRWLATGGRWIHRNFTRENVIQTFKTLASVVPLTILIWVYAEREQIRQEPDVSISIEVRCNDPRRVVSLKKPYPDKVVVAELDGPPSTLDAVVERLERRSGDEPAVEIFVDPLLEPGMVHEIDTAAALSANPLFRGISISSCQPPKLEVYVDELEERDLEVQAPAGITNLVGPPVFTPRTVKVRGPKESLDELEKQHKLIAEAELGSFEAMNVPGPHDFPVVRIKPLDDPNVTFSPPNVEAVVSVRESDVSGTIRSVPIWVYGPPDVMARCHVELSNPVLTNVKVTGPAESIDLVNRPDYSPKPHALLEIKNEDELGKPLERLVRFDLPPDLKLHVNEELSQQKIDFRLVPLDQHAGD
jgi:hypothetical protein